MSENDFENSAMNDGTDLKTTLRDYLHESDFNENPINLLSIDSPYLDIEEIPGKFPLHDNNYLYQALHLNIHSVPEKIDQLKNMLHQFQNIKIEFDFILLCETFLKDNTKNLYNIPGYTLVCKNRQVLAKGGVAIYVRDNIPFKIREDLSVFHEGEFETIFIETTGANHRTIVGEIYRIPNTSETASIERFEVLLNRLQQTGSNVIIGTDQNFDYLKISSRDKPLDLLNLFMSSNLIPTITKPTRVTHTSATLIDNLYVSHDAEVIHSAIIPYNISDHFPVFCLVGRKHLIHSKKGPLMFTHRPINSDALAQIRATLLEIDWAYLNDLDVNAAHANFTEQLHSIVHRYAPERKVVIPAKYVIREDWMTKGLMKSSVTLTKLYKKCVKKQKTELAYTNYVTFRNEYNKLKRIAKKMYYERRFEQYKNDIKGTWKLLNSLIGHTKDKSSAHTVFKLTDNSEPVSSSDKIADEFCKYFTNIGPKLAESIHPSDKSFEAYLKSKRNPNPSSMFLDETDPEEIYKIISALKAKKSSGYDNISTTFLKQVGPEISCPISILVNKSFSEGVVPDILKIGKVIPIYKSNDKELFSNYRPISLLPALSKILEKAMYKRLYNFMDSNKILYQSQYGFREQRSTCQAILEFVTDVVEAIDEKKSTLSVFLDLSKAFDTIDHKILLDKLYFYGVRGIMYDWMKSYLSNRFQYVQYNSSKSDSMSTTCGVPQGSVLGPLLFIIYMNDSTDCLTHAKGILFADDTTVYQSSSSIDLLYITMNLELNILSDWFRANKLSLNASKTNYMLFTNLRNSDNNYVIKICDCALERKPCVKFLGVHIDQNLTWHDHIRICQSKIASSIYAINRVKHFIPHKYVRTLYFSMIYPYLYYGIPLWGSTYNTHKKKLITAQKRIIRIISGAKYNDHTNPLFQEGNILKLDDIYKVEVCKVAYKFKQNLLPLPLKHLFTLNSDIYVRESRQSNDFHVKKCRTTLASQHISCKGPQLWNALPSELKCSTNGSLKRFVSALSKHIIHEYGSSR